MKEMSIISFDTNITLLILYFPCIVLGIFCVGQLIFWSSMKAVIDIERKEIFARILVFFLLAMTCFVMLITDLGISAVELIVFWPPSVFWSCIIFGVPGLIFSTLFIVMKCIESWSEACSKGRRFCYLYLFFVPCWLSCCFIQLIIFSLVIKNIGANSMLDSFN